MNSSLLAPQKQSVIATSPRENIKNTLWFCCNITQTLHKDTESTSISELHAYCTRQTFLPVSPVERVHNTSGDTRWRSRRSPTSQDSTVEGQDKVYEAIKTCLEVKTSHVHTSRWSGWECWVQRGLWSGYSTHKNLLSSMTPNEPDEPGSYCTAYQPVSLSFQYPATYHTLDDGEK